MGTLLSAAFREQVKKTKDISMIKTINITIKNI